MNELTVLIDTVLLVRHCIFNTVYTSITYIWSTYRIHLSVTPIGLDHYSAVRAKHLLMPLSANDAKLPAMKARI